MHTFRSICVGLALLSSGALSAAPCQFLSQGDALAAVKAMKVGSTILFLCEACGEIDAKPVSVRALSIARLPSSDAWGVFVNGKAVDLSSTFVKKPEADDGDYFNLATLTSCDTSGVSELLHIGG